MNVRSGAVVLGVAIGATLSASGQSGDPATREPAWVGVFAEPREELRFVFFRGAGGACEGALLSDEPELGLRDLRAAGDQVQGSVVEGPQVMSFTARVEGDALVVAITDRGRTETLRMPRVAGAPRRSAEVRAYLEEQRRGGAPPGGSGAPRTNPGGGTGGNQVERNETSAIGALKTIANSEAIFREADKERDDNFDYGTLAELRAADLIDAVLGTGRKNGYVFDVRPSTSTPDFLWLATASPIEPGASGARYFAMNHAGVVYYSTRRPAAWNDECRIPEFMVPLGSPEGPDAGPSPSGGGPGPETKMGAPDGPPAQGPAPDLTGLRVGQCYEYSLPAAPQMRIVYEITALDTAAGRVTYRMLTLMDMGSGRQAVGDPQEDQVWPLAPSPQVVTTAPGVTVTRETVEVAGQRWECQVTRTGDLLVYAPVNGDRPRFPFFVRTAQGGAVTMELVEVRQP